MESLRELTGTAAALSLLYVAVTMIVTGKLPRRSMGLLGLAVVLPFTVALIKNASGVGDATLLVIAAGVICVLSARLLLGRDIWSVVIGSLIYDVLKAVVRVSGAAFSKALSIFRSGF